MPQLPSFALRDPRDRLAVLLSAAPVVVLASSGSPWLVGLAIWWLGNTVAHHATHRRLFRDARVERAFGLWLTLGLGVPQRLWQRRHLAHHADRRRLWRGLRWDGRLAVEAALLGLAWRVALTWWPAWCLAVYAPGLVFGLVLAALHGHFEHAGGVTDHRAAWWNRLLCNDGFHAEHHAAPRLHWRELPARRLPGVRISCLPPPVRWLAYLTPASLLDGCERLVLRSAWLQRRVLAAHRAALAQVLQGEAAPRTIGIVGGGLFPRSAILLRELYPQARICVFDVEAAHLRAAQAWLPPGVQARVQRLVPGQRLDVDLVVLPLALRGARRQFVQRPPAARVLVHDWAWHRLGDGRLVAWWLAKRVYLVRGTAAALAVSA